MDGRKEFYEIDPNSSFNQLRRLQKTLKTEGALREIFIKKKEEILKKINNKTIEYYQLKLKVKENNERISNYTMAENNIQPIHYELAIDPNDELPQCSDLIRKYMFFFREDISLIIKTIDKCDPSQYDRLSNFLCHFFYNNILSPKIDTGHLYLLIYLLLEKEIDSLPLEEKSLKSFLKEKSFISEIFISLTRKVEVKDYLELILEKIILDLEQVYKVNNDNKENKEIREKIPFFTLDPLKIKEFLKEHFKFKINKKKRVVDCKNFLISNIKLSSISMYVLEAKKRNLFNEANKENFESQIEHSKPKAEMDKELEKLLEDSDLFEMGKKDKISKLRGSTLKVFKDEENPVKYSKEYEIDLNKEKLETKMRTFSTERMVYYFKGIVEQIASDQEIFTNRSLYNELLVQGKETEKVIIFYKYYFENSKNFIDTILSSILIHEEEIPYIIKFICVVIDRLLTIKYKGFSELDRNVFIGEFFFNHLLIPTLNNPSINGFVLLHLNMNELRKDKIDIITQLLRHLYQANLFNTSEENEYYFTLFNTYLIEIMPIIFQIFDMLKNAKLPHFIERILNDKKKKNIVTKEVKKEKENDESKVEEFKDPKYEFNLLKEYPNEDVEHQSMCFTWKDFFIFYETAEKNEDFFFPNKDSMLYKTFKKLSFHLKVIDKKYETDVSKNKRTYIYYSQINWCPKLKNQLKIKKEIKFSFQRSDVIKENKIENFVLTRVKYSIMIIIKNLSILTRANFFVDQSESTENFVKSLSKMMELEGFSEMLKEKTIPLSWFGLYLMANIENIPSSHRRVNYFQLYKELEDDSLEKLVEIENNECLNIVYSKLKIVDKYIAIENDHLNACDRLEQKSKILLFIKKAPIQVCLISVMREGVFIGLQIETIDKCEHNKKFSLFFKKIQTHFDTIQEFVENFPQFAGKYNNEDDLLSYEIKKKVPETLEKYYELIWSALESSIIFKGAKQEELRNVFNAIHNYINEKIYYKVFPRVQSKEDSVYFKRCKILGWLKLEHFGPQYESYDDNLVNIAIDYLKKIDTECSPKLKLEAFLKAEDILMNIKMYYDINECNLNQLILYSMIKAAISMPITCLRYMRIFLGITQLGRYSEILDKFELEVNSIKFFNNAFLKGITLEQYDENCNKVAKGDVDIFNELNS